jgi:hypothetical protein
MESSGRGPIPVVARATCAYCILVQQEAKETVETQEVRREDPRTHGKMGKHQKITQIREK